MFSAYNSCKIPNMINSHRDKHPIKLFVPAAACRLVTEKVIQLFPLQGTLNSSYSTKNSNGVNEFNFNIKTHENKSNLRASVLKSMEESIHTTRSAMSLHKVLVTTNTQDSKSNLENNRKEKNNKSSFHKSMYSDPIIKTINLQNDNFSQMQNISEGKTIIEKEKINMKNGNDTLSSKSLLEKNEGNIIDDFLILEEKFGFIINVKVIVIHTQSF